MAQWKGLDIAINKGIQNLIILRELMLFIRMVVKLQSSSDQVSPPVYRRKFLQMNKLVIISFYNVRRHLNEVVDKLAIHRSELEVGTLELNGFDIGYAPLL